MGRSAQAVGDASVEPVSEAPPLRLRLMATASLDGPTEVLFVEGLLAELLFHLAVRGLALRGREYLERRSGKVRLAWDRGTVHLWWEEEDESMRRR